MVELVFMLVSKLFKTNVERVFARLHSGATNDVGGRSERSDVKVSILSFMI